MLNMVLMFNLRFLIHIFIKRRFYFDQNTIAELPMLNLSFCLFEIKENRRRNFKLVIKRFMCLCIISQDIGGNDVSLSQFKGKTLLVVNVASKW